MTITIKTTEGDKLLTVLKESLDDNVNSQYRVKNLLDNRYSSHCWRCIYNLRNWQNSERRDQDFLGLSRVVTDEGKAKQTEKLMKYPNPWFVESLSLSPPPVSMAVLDHSPGQQLCKEKMGIGKWNRHNKTGKSLIYSAFFLIFFFTLR